MPAKRLNYDHASINQVVFEDGTYAGENPYKLSDFVRREGEKIQSPSMLKMIEHTLEASDDEIEAAFIKLEADLWQIPEAISKDSALELLRSKHSSLDGKEISSLYEHLKGGLYDARNHALAPLGNLKRWINEAPHLTGEANKESRVKMIRDTLLRLKDDFEKLLARQ